MNVFAQNACEYADRGLAAFPVDTRHKRPAVKGWQSATPQHARNWAKSPRLGSNTGLGIVMGKQSCVTEIDVDAVGEAWLAAAVQKFGETPISIITASGKSKLWYRHNGESRLIRPFEGLPIDVLGAGFTIAPPSWREDLGASYEFRTGSLSDIANLPTIPTEALGTTSFQIAEGVQSGRRNHSLWRWCMAQARHCDDVAALIDVAATWVNAFPEPLSVAEIERCAKSAWKYESTGRNYLGLKKPHLTEGDFIMDTLIDHPEAFALHQLFQRWHGKRSSFAIAPRAMSEAGNPPWPRRRIELARDILLERGYLEELSAPTKAKRKAGLYRLNSHKVTGERVYSDCAQIREVSEAPPMTSRNNGTNTDGRNSDGTFAEGNPGRPKGARHKITRAVEDLLEGEAEGLTRKAVDLALEGDTTALRLCLERIAPPRKDAPVAFELPSMESAKEATLAAQAVLQAVSNGDLTPLEGASVMALVEGYRKTLETTELESRIAALEAKQ